MIFIPGETVIARARITSQETGALVDPSTVKFYLLRPHETVPELHEIPTSTVLSKAADGVYQADIPLSGSNLTGVWRYRWECEGVLTNGAAEGTFRCQPSQVLPPT